MINEKELLISNTSYTNKDFPSIYLELLDIIRNLTNKWDPATSNESDPGVVIAKLIAFLGDKLNYNSDKNLLERFMLSATQATSMRELCEMMGYPMKYYVSAETKVTFMYSKSTDDSEILPSDTIYIPMFTVVSSLNDDIKYVTTKACNLDSYHSWTGEVGAIEGELQTLVVNDSDVINLSNLDDSLRLYFPIPNVAQNGIFIRNIDNNEYWTSVNNLNSQQLGQHIFKFGFDSIKGKPFVEFPSDIINLIGSGLYVQYIASSGVNGNVKAKYLTVLSSPSSFNVVGTNGDIKEISFKDNESGLTIFNPSASINGSNPETIDNAYNGFKKTIGTFDTLVTCRDYANYIYNALNVENYPIVSNIQVTDRRTDVNYACNILTFDEFGTKIINKPIHTIGDRKINAFDLCIYPLNPIITYVDTGIDQFVKSFQKLESIVNIENELEGSSKSISHDYVHPSGNAIYAIKNYMTLNVIISTVNKVYPTEQEDIIRNVKTKLVENFNARQVDYGYEIPYDNLLKVIKEADARISFVSLAEPVLTTKVMKADNSESLLDSSTKSEIAALNVISGKIPLFNYDDDFKYELGQTNAKTELNLTSVDTRFLLPQENLRNQYQLKANEVIQLLAPSYITVDGYGAYINYSFYSPTTGKRISADTIYQLAEGEYLYFFYTQDNKIKFEFYQEGDIIQPVGLDIFAPNIGATPGSSDYRPYVEKTLTELGFSDTSDFFVTHQIVKDPNTQKYVFNVLKATESVNIKQKNEVVLDSPRYCYWLVNNADNQLFATGVNERLLEDGEYFFYTDSSFTNLYSVGGGTTLIKSGVTTTTNWKAQTVSLTDITEKGLLSLKDKWVKLAFAGNGFFKISENSILTLTAADIIQIPGFELENGATTLTNDLQGFTKTDKISYVIEGQETSYLDDLNIVGAEWKIKSRLDINAGFNYSQEVLQYHELDFYSADSGSPKELRYNSTNTVKFNLSETVQVAGGDNIDLTQINVVTQAIETPVKLYSFEMDSSEPLITRDSNDYAVLMFDDSDTNKKSYTFSLPGLANEDAILMVYWIPDGDSELTITPDNGALYNMNTNTVITETDGKGIYNLLAKTTQVIKSITFTINQGGKGSLIVDRIKYLKIDSDTGIYNPLLGLTLLEGNSTLNLIRTYDEDHNFYYTNRIDNDRAINVDKNYSLMSPYMFYDFNNVFNRFTLSEIDFDTSLFSIARSSKY